MVNFGPLAAEIVSGVWGTPAILSTASASWQRYCTACSSVRQTNFAALNRGRHLCSAGRPSRWALAHILVQFQTSFLRCIDRNWNNQHDGCGSNLSSDDHCWSVITSTCCGISWIIRHWSFTADVTAVGDSGVGLGCLFLISCIWHWFPTFLPHAPLLNARVEVLWMKGEKQLTHIQNALQQTCSFPGWLLVS